MRLLVFAVSTVVIIAGLHWTVEGRMTRTVRSSDDDADDIVSCDFKDSLCGWKSERTAGYNLHWERGSSIALAGTYAFIDVYNSTAGDTARLASPKLPAQPGGVKCTLSINWCFVGSRSCVLELSLYEKVGEGGEEKQLWSATGTYFYSCSSSIDPMTIYVNCNTSDYWIYLGGKVFSNVNVACGLSAGIVVDDIQYRIEDLSTSPGSVTPTTGSSPITSFVTDYSTAVPGTATGGLDSGAIAGIAVVVVIGVLVAVAVGVGVGVVIGRRQGGGSEGQGRTTGCFRGVKNTSAASESRATGTVTNSAFLSDNEHTPGVAANPDGNNCDHVYRNVSPIMKTNPTANAASESSTRPQ